MNKNNTIKTKALKGLEICLVLFITIWFIPNSIFAQEYYGYPYNYGLTQPYYIYPPYLKQNSPYNYIGWSNYYPDSAYPGSFPNNYKAYGYIPYGATYSGYASWYQPYNYDGGYSYPFIRNAARGGYDQYSPWTGYNLFSTSYSYPDSSFPPYQFMESRYNFNPYQLMESQFKDADVELDYDDDGEEIILERGETLSIVLPSHRDEGIEWHLDNDELDDNIVDKKSDKYFSGYVYGFTAGVPAPYGGGVGAREQWIFKALDTGSTTIKLEYIDEDDDRITFEIEVTVIED